MVESVNAALKGSFVELARGFFRVMGRVKTTLLLSFTLAAYNLDRVRSFKSKQVEMEANPRRRAKRRRGTWADLVATEGQVTPAQTGDPPI